MASLEFSDAAWAAVSEGIFIPVSDLVGSVASEYAATVSGSAKQGQFAFSFLKKLRAKLSGTSYLTTQDAANYLGFTQTKTENIPTVGVKNHIFSFTFQWYGKKGSNFSMLPVSTTGTFLNGGMLTFDDADLFPAAAKVAAAGNTPGAGVLIPSSELVPFGIVSHASIDLTADCRMLIQAILNWLKDKELLIRSATVASAVTTLTRTTTSFTIPAAAFDAINPTTGLGGSANINQNLYMGSSETISFTLQNLEDDAEVTSLRVVTA